MVGGTTTVVAAWVVLVWWSVGVAAQEGASRWLPVVSGPWRVLYEPLVSGPNVNDHTIFLDSEGNWRFVGISAFPGLDLRTPYLGHAVGRSLDMPMNELPVLFHTYPDSDPKWAPHVIEHEGLWHLFCGPGRIRHYISTTGASWLFVGYAVESDWNLFRDSMVLELDTGGWLMYCTDRNNTVSVYSSDDLFNWSFEQIAFRAISPATVYPWWLDISSTESPFVIPFDGAFYLSVTLTSAFEPDSYARTIVVRSEDPLDFGVYAAGAPGETADLVTILETHAPEYVHAPDGSWHITNCGWQPVPGAEGIIPGAVAIAPLEWKQVPAP